MCNEMKLTRATLAVTDRALAMTGTALARSLRRLGQESFGIAQNKRTGNAQNGETA
jgi:hypothetical protein